MLKYYIYFSVFIATSFCSINAQYIKIQGIVKDSINQPLAYANVFAEPKNDSLKITYAVSDEQGKYNLRILKNKAYNVSCSFIGYLKKDVVFNYAKDTTYHFILKEDLHQLNEIKLSFHIPITVKKDTTTYKVVKFTTGNERKLKEVLKKLPGIEVDRKGNVTAHGKKVTKLLVEDKPFFGGNTKLGVNNIPADAVDKVQVIEDYNEIAMLKGLTDDGKVALNIKLKEDKKKFVFGDIETGVGITNKYVLHPKLFYYSPKTSVNFIGDLTNTGEKSFTFRDYIKFERTSKIIIDFKSLMNSYQSNFSQFLIDTDYKTDKTLFGALNIRHSVNKSIDINFYAINAKSTTLFETQSKNQYLLGNGFLENRNYNTNKDNFFSISKLGVTYRPNRNTDYLFSTHFNTSKSHSEANILSNTINDNKHIKENYNLDAFSLKQILSLNKKLTKKHTLAFNANFNYQKDVPNTSWQTNQEILEGLIPIISSSIYTIKQDKYVTSQGFNFALKDYWKIANLHHIYTSLGMNNAKTNFNNSDYQLLENGTINNFEIANFGNDFTHDFLDTYIGLEYKVLLGKFTLSPAIFLHKYRWSLNQKNESKQAFNKTIALPQLSIKVDIKKSEKINFRYHLNAKFAKVNMLLSNFILTDFNRVYSGDPTLSNALYHSFSFNYYRMKRFKNYHLSFGASLNKKVQQIKNSTAISGINQFNTSKMFYEPEINWKVRSRFSNGFGKIKTKLKLTYNFNAYYQLINNTQRLNKSKKLNIQPSLETLFDKFPNIEIGYKKAFTNYQYNTAIKYTNDTFFVYFDYDYKDFIFSADFEYENYQNLTDNSIKNTFNSGNFSVFYQKEDHPWGYELNARNVFDTKFKQFNHQNIFYINDSKTFILPRTIMFKVIYKL